jgi:hypothetical protein
MERITRQESERSSDLQLKTSASGGAFGVTASASSSAGVKTSAKSFAQGMAKVAKNASKSVTEQNREEVTTSSTQRTTIKTTDETTAEIRNINEGRTLNLMFYRLYNQYKGGMYIDGLQFHLVQSVETIAGSGVFEAETYSLSEFQKLLKQLAVTPLPFDLNTQGRQELELTIICALCSLLGEEYTKVTDSNTAARSGEGEEEKSLQISRSVGVIPIDPPKEGPGAAPVLNAIFGIPGYRPSEEESKDARDQLDEFLRNAIVKLETSKQIEPVDLMVGSGGLYLDAYVGQIASTEPYSENMRVCETDMRKAEIRETLSKAVLREKLAGKIAGEEIAEAAMRKTAEELKEEVTSE